MESVGFVQCSHENIFHDVVYLYECSVGNKNECTEGQTCQSVDSAEQVEVNSIETAPNPSNILIVPEDVQVSSDSTVEVTAPDATPATPSADTVSAEGKKIKKKSMKKKKKLIKD